METIPLLSSRRQIVPRERILQPLHLARDFVGVRKKFPEDCGCPRASSSFKCFGSCLPHPETHAPSLPHCSARHLLTLTPDFRLARGAETAVAAALREPVVRPRVLLVQQWCIDAPDPQFEVAGALPEVPPLTMDDLRERYSEGTAALCHKHGADTRNNYYWFGVKTAEEMGTMTKGDNGKSKGPLRGSRARRTQDGLVGNGLILLKADAVSPVMVVDLWSAPALFLRHVEVNLPYVIPLDRLTLSGHRAAGFIRALVAPFSPV